MNDQEVSAKKFLDLLIRDLERALDHARNARGALGVPRATPESEDPGLPPTTKQIAYAKSLGVQIPQGVTRHRLSRMIKEALDERRKY